MRYFRFAKDLGFVQFNSASLILGRSTQQHMESLLAADSYEAETNGRGGTARNLLGVAATTSAA